MALMNAILKMQNSIQAYQWGSCTAIAQLMKRRFPTEKPEAELWLGAHPKSPSRVWLGDRWQAMDRWIDQTPDQILGPGVATRFNGKLPYLFKILAAGQPLSIQAHPNKAQAVLGFDKENEMKIPMDAEHRNYKDPHHKPECLCALTPFWVLCGFRHPKEILSILQPFWPSGYQTHLTILEQDGVKGFFSQLMTMAPDIRMALIQKVVEKASPQSSSDAVASWMDRLQLKYPGDVGVLAPAFLNLIQLKPGEAVALAAGHLHAYLDGTGIELMANSDNVLRGGLTSKHIDVPELLNILRFDTYYPEIMHAHTKKNNEKFYPSQAEEFILHVITTTAQSNYVLENRNQTPEILLCIDGKARVAWRDETKAIEIEQGQSLFVTAGVDQYSVSGNAVIYKAGVNI